MSKILLLYYSRKGQNYWNGSVKNLPKGNTQIAAEIIQKAVGGSMSEVETVKKYPDDYHVCTEEAKAELQSNSSPEAKAYIDSIDGYGLRRLSLLVGHYTKGQVHVYREIRSLRQKDCAFLHS